MKILGVLAAWGVIVAAVLLTLPVPAEAGGVIGSGPGTCTSAELNAKLAGGGQFTFDCGPGPVTIVLTNTPQITSDTSLDGAGLITISGGTTREVFSVIGGGLTLSNLTVADGHSHSAAGIYVFSTARLTLLNTNFVNNVAINYGGAIYSDGQLTITGGLFYSNTAHFAGGAIFNAGQAAISGASFLSNTAALGGGALENNSFGRLTIQASRLQGNTATGRGGAIRNSGSVTLTQDTLFQNVAQAGNFGGGLANDTGGVALVTGSTFDANGAIAGGGLTTSSTVTISNTTFSANSGFGGAGVEVEAGLLAVLNSTFYKNISIGANAIENDGGVVFVKNTILAGSPRASCTGVINSLGHNLDDGNNCLLNATGDMTTTNPLLGPLADNGGPTQTHALLPGSPAIKHGDNNGCPAIDQRGYPRAFGCDIGAFEYAFRLLLAVVRK